jgi:hypothetical protein
MIGAALPYKNLQKSVYCIDGLKPQIGGKALLPCTVVMAASHSISALLIQQPNQQQIHDPVPQLNPKTAPAAHLFPLLWCVCHCQLLPDEPDVLAVTPAHPASVIKWT